MQAGVIIDFQQLFIVHRGVDPHQDIQVMNFRECSISTGQDLMVTWLYMDTGTCYIFWRHLHGYVFSQRQILFSRFSLPFTPER